DQEAKALLLREEIITYHENGKVSKQYYMIDNKIDGEYKEWFDNGQLCVHCFYKDGKGDSKIKIWDKDGKLIVYQVYKNGKFIKDLSEKIDDNRSKS
ncbi:MAG TPA: hypothetical protein P5277_05095, partial [Candidatus Paceibacterota bacterium]|nr:hypothetical protein [Candidatus Paceibacterota bacterium]